MNSQSCFNGENKHQTDREFIVFCDESDRSGRFYSDFYGGVLVGSSHYERITNRLLNLKSELNLGKEVKWSRVSESYLAKYQQLVSVFFDEVRAGNLKVRIMFRQNARLPRNLTADQRERGYYLLYYQFIKHAFGFHYAEPAAEPRRVRLYFDEFPDRPDHALEFRDYIQSLAAREEFLRAGLQIFPEDIQEIRSHDHVLLQCVDVVLGAMTFRLNNKHLEKPEGSVRRGKRTIAKEKLYNHIRKEIQTIRPNFNIGISTGSDGDPANKWRHAYRHWAFVPSEGDYEQALTKRKGSLKRREPDGSLLE
jgi:hypothetical protein